VKGAVIDPEKGGGREKGEEGVNQTETGRGAGEERGIRMTEEGVRTGGGTWTKGRKRRGTEKERGLREKRKEGKISLQLIRKGGKKCLGEKKRKAVEDPVWLWYLMRMTVMMKTVLVFRVTPPEAEVLMVSPGPPPTRAPDLAPAGLGMMVTTQRCPELTPG